MKKFAGIIFSLCFILISQRKRRMYGTEHPIPLGTIQPILCSTYHCRAIGGLAVMVNNGNSFQKPLN